MKAGQTTLEQAKTVPPTSRILSQATKVRLRYKRANIKVLITSNQGVHRKKAATPSPPPG